MKTMIAYFNCFSGISGDMILGALVDAGVSIEELKKELTKLPIGGYELKSKTVKKTGTKATKVDVVLKAEDGRRKAEVRKWQDIQKIINTSKLSEEIKQKGLQIFRRLFEAEAKVHGGRIQDIHLHELGAVDCIVDIFGTLIGLDLLGIEKVYSSPLNVGSGTIKTGHGTLPVPAPATARLLKGITVYSSGTLFELTTPTGAVLISSLAESFTPMPRMNISKTATGAGDKDFKDHPNVLLMIIGEEAEGGRRKTEDGITVIETNIDDMNPQVYEYVMERLFRAGALDVFLTQIIMKKGRPGITLSVLCDETRQDDLMDIILTETTSIGLRFYRAERKILQREIRAVRTKYGNMHMKVAQLGKGIRKSSPEYEDCKRIAKKFNIPLLEVMKAIGEENKGAEAQRHRGSKGRSR
jgi:uncharacterized protein (TIGR00299 family) protein